MNLVAKEAPFVNGRDGVVVLSENAGAHEEIGDWTVTVNPFDIEGMATALHEALTMPPDERRRRGRGAHRVRRATRRRGPGRTTSSPTSIVCAAYRHRLASPAMTELSHVDESSGDVQMVDVGHKPVLARARRSRGRPC